MSVSSTPSNSSSTTASRRLASAMAAARGERAPHAAEPAPSTPPAATRTARVSGDAMRGASGAPAFSMTGADAAEQGADELGATSMTTTAQPGPVLEPGRDAGSVASADGPTAQDVMPAGQPGTAAPGAPQSAWSPQWEQRFADLMERMGLPKGEIEAQLQAVAGQPATAAQLEQAYAQMEAALGDYDDRWQERFSTLMQELKTPAKDREQVLQQLAASGLTTAQLQQAYDQMAASKPAWDAEWENRFKSLQVPEELLAQLRDSGAPREALEQQFRKLLDTRLEYQRDGRLERLEDAKATPEEQWGVMLEGTKGKEFDKLVEQIHSRHVSGWKRVGSFALNLIPGVYAVQFLTGKDWVTGEKIDRTNPLNIVGAVASGFAGFTAVRSAVQGVQGLTAANAAFTAGKASAGLKDAISAANLTTKFTTGLKPLDYIKAATPIVNRFGEAGRLSAVGRGYFQGMQLAAGAAAMRGVEGGGAFVDKAMKGRVLEQLRTGTVGIDQALRNAGRADDAGFLFRNADLARSFDKVGFLQGNVSGRFGVGTGSGAFTFNPFRNTRTIATTANANLLSLGRGVNFGSTGGLAQGLGAVQGMNAVQLDDAARAAMLASGNELMRNGGEISKRITGMSGIADDAQRISTMKRTAYWADKLGVSGGSPLHSLFRFGSNRQAASIANVVEHGGSGGYRAARIAGDLGRRYGGVVATPLVAGAAVGLTGRQMQPAWDYVKQRDEIRAAEQAAAQQAEREAAELERLYQQQYGSGTGGAADAAQGAATNGEAAPGAADPALGPQVVGTSPQTGGQLVFDPDLGAVYDATSGDVYDPQTGQHIGNLAQAQAQVQGQAQGSTTGIDPQAGAPAPGVDAGSATGGAGAGQVYQDPQTGYWVDAATGLMADPATGRVYDPRTGQVVAELGAGGAAQQPAA